MGKLIVVSGPSGVGKGKVIEELIKIYGEEGKKIFLSVSDTTRAPRSGEIDHVHYNFITQDEFKKNYENGNYLESNDYSGNRQLYGTPLMPVKEHLENGYDVLLDIDINGFKQVLNKYPNNTIGFFITVDFETLENRLRGRGTETEEKIQSRLATARKEVAASTIYPHKIVNEDNKVRESAMEIYEILENQYGEKTPCLK